MSEQESKYQKALDYLEHHNHQVKQVFEKRAGGDGVVDMNNIGDLINDLSSLIGVDLGKAKEFFSKQNESIPASFNLDSTTFDDFIELLKIWLKRKATKKSNKGKELKDSLHESQTLQSNLDSYRSPDQGNQEIELTNRSQKLGKKSTERKKKLSRNMIVPPPNYKMNREKLDELLLKHREEFHKKFFERSDEETETISLIDFFIFLQDCFYLDTVLLKAKVTDDQDFFQLSTSYNKLIEMAESYFINVRGREPEEFDVKEEKLTFNECFDIVDHWFQIDENVIMVNENESSNKKQVVQQANNNQSDVRSALLETIEKYRKMLDASNNEVEKEILQATIDTLYKKLGELDNGGLGNNESRSRQNSKLIKKREEKRMKALREIFDFYAKQQLNGIKPITFDNLERQFKTLSIGKFSMILKNFRIKMDQFVRLLLDMSSKFIKKLKELFKKFSSNSEDLNFDEFCFLLPKVAKDAEFVTEAKVVKPNPEIMKEYKPDSYKKNPTQKDNQKDDSKKKDEANKKDDPNKIEDMWNHMGLYDGGYRNYMQLVQLAFNSQEKESFRIDPESMKNKLKKEPKTIDEIKEEVARRNKLREVIKEVKKEEKAVFENYKETPSSAIPTYSTHMKYDSYALQARKEKALPIFTDKKMTLKDVGNSKYNEIRDRGVDVKFNPRDLIEENDEEDNYYLADYTLTLQKPLVPQTVEKEELEHSKSNPKLKVLKRQSTLQGRYSRNHEYKASRVGTTSPALNGPKSQSKLLSADENEIDFTKNLPSSSGIASGPLRSSAVISQSVKNLIANHANHNLKNIPYNLNNNDGQVDSRERLYPILPRPDRINHMDMNRKGGNGVLDRVNKIQQDSRKREYEIMTNLINIQNTKLEQGLRVARK